MVLTNPTTATFKTLTEQWLDENDTPERHAKYMTELRSRVLAYEAQFGIQSSDVHDAIEDGRLQETLNVCEWLMDLYVLDPATTVDH
jgi:hypothetical protein